MQRIWPCPSQLVKYNLISNGLVLLPTLRQMTTGTSANEEAPFEATNPVNHLQPLSLGQAYPAANRSFDLFQFLLGSTYDRIEGNQYLPMDKTTDVSAIPCEPLGIE